MRMLSKIVKEINELVLESSAINGNIDIIISGIKYDSRLIKEGDTFFAINGYNNDGHEYIEEAIKNGAALIVIEKPEYCSDSYPWILVKNSRQALAEFSAAYYDHPSKKMTLIGVTGTNGKTTTVNMIADVLKNMGKKTGVIGTINIRIDNQTFPIERTTPESSDLQEIFVKMLENEVTHVVMEVSSHSLELERVRCCKFDHAVFTNLTQDHLDFHQDMDNYFLAKKKLFLFTSLRSSIINTDDQWGAKLVTQLKGKKILTYAIDKTADYHARNTILSENGVEYKLEEKTTVTLGINGRFNIYNSLAAFAVLEELGITKENIARSFKDISPVRGRFQKIDIQAPFKVIIDYAHTPDGLRNILTTAQEFVQGRIICVFGCGGDRDRTKRPLMGKIAKELADYLIITSDNPRTEKPGKIIEDILNGVSEEGYSSYVVIENREMAIKKAIEMARENDLVIIAGKGHENYQEINGVKHHFDDNEIASKYIHQVLK